MKKIKTFFLMLAAVLCVGSFAACDELSALKDKYFPSSESDERVSEESIEESTEPETSEGEEEKAFGEGYETITIAEALELCGEPGNVTQERYYIIGKVETITDPAFGAMVISDETGSISVFNTKSLYYVNYEDMAEKPVKGDTVLLACFLQNYEGTKEVKQAYLVDFEKEVIDESDYVEMTIADARTAAEGALVKVTGVVGQITYAFGQAPNGVMLLDKTGSIYVFDSDLAREVEEGNTLTLLATKTYWILEKEQTAAAKFGYKGCNQLTDATLLSNDGENKNLPTNAIQETTIKDIMETPVTEDFTTIVYKVNALVKKVPGSGFTNYIFNDIDGETGSYTYTQCNGNDFKWLDEFDGQICTVYLTVLNAKSSDAGCVYRFLPIEVKDEGYEFDTENTARFVLDYYGIEQFETLYTGDPKLELITEVSSELLGFEGATLSYKSNKTDVVYFETVEGKTILHCGEVGKALVTVSVTYEGKEAQSAFYVTVEKGETYDYLTVAEAIATEVGTENIIVKGIVGPSVANQVAFYLFGEDGSAITVRTTSETFVGLEIGNEVIVQGTRKTITKGGAEYFGQTAIDDAVLLENYYGKHEYSTAKFVDTTAAEFYALDAKVDYSTTVFVFTATINFVDEGRYTTLNLTSGETTVSLYMSGAGDYAWLKDYYGEEVTMEIAACNWTDKKYWRGCILAIRNADGTKLLNTANFDEF